MLVVLLAGPILSERIGALGLAAVSIGFVDVLLIARPGSGLDVTGTIFAFCAVGVLIIYQLFSRMPIKTEHTFAMLFYTAFIGSVAYGIFLPWSLHGPTPKIWELLLFLSMGVTGGLGHFLFTTAYRHAPASLLAPMNTYNCSGRDCLHGLCSIMCRTS